MSLNVAHGRKLARQQLLVRGERFRANLAEVASVLRREQPHVVGLQEADAPSFWSGDFHHVEHLAELAGYDHHFHGEHNTARIGRRAIATGTALLSRLPLRDPASHILPRPRPTSRKGFVVASVAADGNGRHVDVASVHLDFLWKAVRRRQVAHLEEMLAHRRNPLVIVGDMNCWWDRRRDALRLLVDRLGVRPCRPGDGELATFPSRRPRYRIDWILVSPELEFASYQTVVDRVSDHLAVVAEVRPRQAG
ncbi:MAG: endonuclease/exonuclease/phosphatase family protein [Candidatus Brocadiia bacterium]